MANEEIIEVFTAFSKGKTIQGRNYDPLTSGMWRDFSGSVKGLLRGIEAGLEFRVKPDKPAKPETREVNYPVEVLGEMYVIRRAGQTRNITKLPGMVGFRHFIFDDGVWLESPVCLRTDPSDKLLKTKVAQFAVFEETPCK